MHVNDPYSFNKKPLKLRYPKLDYRQAQLYNFNKYNYFTLHKHSLHFPFHNRKCRVLKLFFVSLVALITFRLEAEIIISALFSLDIMS